MTKWQIPSVKERSLVRRLIMTVYARISIGWISFINWCVEHTQIPLIGSILKYFGKIYGNHHWGKVYTLEDMNALIKKLPENSIIVRGICACRVARKPCQKFYNGKCDHPVDTCIFIKYGAEKFLKARKETKKISKNEVKRLFQTMFQRGFFLSLYFCVDKQEYAICICCRDGCIPTVSTLDYNLNGLVKGDKYATVITEKCIGCGLCQEVCSFDAIVLESVAKINQNKCFGCGQCLSCPNGAIQLVERSDSNLKIS